MPRPCLTSYNDLLPSPLRAPAQSGRRTVLQAVVTRQTAGEREPVPVGAERPVTSNTTCPSLGIGHDREPQQPHEFPQQASIPHTACVTQPVDRDDVASPGRRLKTTSLAGQQTTRSLSLTEPRRPFAQDRSVHLHDQPRSTPAVRRERIAGEIPLSRFPSSVAGTRIGTDNRGTRRRVHPGLDTQAGSTLFACKASPAR